MTVPRQLLVRTKKGANNITVLPYETSLLDIKADIPDKQDTAVIKGLRLFSLPATLISCTPASYSQNPTDIRAALARLSQLDPKNIFFTGMASPN